MTSSSAAMVLHQSPDKATTALPFHQDVSFCPGLSWDRCLLSSLYIAVFLIQRENNVDNILIALVLSQGLFFCHCVFVSCSAGKKVHKRNGSGGSIAVTGHPKWPKGCSPFLFVLCFQLLNWSYLNLHVLLWILLPIPLGGDGRGELAEQASVVLNFRLRLIHDTFTSPQPTFVQKCLISKHCSYTNLDLSALRVKFLNLS